MQSIMLQKEILSKFEWLKNIKESHGSVAVNALTQAESINARGIYYVGKISTDAASVRNYISCLV